MDRDLLLAEFTRQVHTLIEKGYPQTVGMTPEEFTKHLEKLKERLAFVELPEKDMDNGILPFVIVINQNNLSADQLLSSIDHTGHEAYVNMYPLTPSDFSTVEYISTPKDKTYALISIDRGKDTLNVPPREALKRIEKKQRLPLTIYEGIAILIQYPEFLKKNNCFSLLASRHAGDERVPALWITGEKKIRLGWCWNGNPHTWLGSASAGKRIGFE